MSPSGDPLPEAEDGTLHCQRGDQLWRLNQCRPDASAKTVTHVNQSLFKTLAGYAVAGLVSATYECARASMPFYTRTHTHTQEGPQHTIATRPPNKQHIKGDRTTFVISLLGRAFCMVLTRPATNIEF